MWVRGEGICWWDRKMGGRDTCIRGAVLVFNRRMDLLCYNTCGY